MKHEETIHFSWSSQDNRHKPKTKMWYITCSLIALGLIGLGIFLKSYLFGLLILISYFIIIQLASKKHDNIFIAISENGISIEENYFDYKKIESFEIKKDQNDSKLFIKTQNIIRPVEVIDITKNINEFSLKEFLSERLEEGEIRYPLTEKIMELIGF